MVKVRDEYDYSTDDVIDEIESEGMIFIAHRWIPIECIVEVYKESQSGKAYFGDITVHECDDTGDTVDILFNKEKTWIPVSMSDNVWWICTILFNHPGKVSNRRFDGYE